MELKDFVDLTHSLGSPIAGVALFLIYRSMRLADRVLDTLRKIHEAVIANGATAERIEARQTSKLDQIHEDVLSLPLSLLRARK